MTASREQVPWLLFPDLAKVAEILATPPPTPIVPLPIEEPAMEPYDPARHLKLLAAWAPAGGPPLADLLPATGFIVAEDAAAFLYGSDSKVAWIDGIFTNPSSSPLAQCAAIERLLHALRAEAKRLGYLRVVCSTSFESVSVLLKHTGFLMYENVYLGIARP